MSGLPPLAVQWGGVAGLPACVTAAGWVPLPGASGLRARVMAFDPGRFHDDQFARHGIACPPRVAASVARRRCEFLCGRLAADGALSALGRGGEPVGMGPVGEPCWPVGVTGSLSHAGGLAAGVALHDDGGRRRVGLDVERVFDDDALAAAASVALSAVERERLHAACRSAGDVGFAAAATAAFCAKEAFYKLVYADVRHLLDFDVVSIEQADLASGCLALRVVAPLPGPVAGGLRLTARVGALPGGELVGWIAWGGAAAASPDLNP